jgi:hypothetical protein
MTEEEAKTKLCPQAIEYETRENCHGSDCMAWRWIPLNANTPEYIAALKECEKERGMTAKGAAKYVLENKAEFALPTKPFEGYCGLAGKP